MYVGSSRLNQRVFVTRTRNNVRSDRGACDAVQEKRDTRQFGSFSKLFRPIVVKYDPKEHALDHSPPRLNSPTVPLLGTYLWKQRWVWPIREVRCNPSTPLASRVSVPLFVRAERHESSSHQSAAGRAVEGQFPASDSCTSL